ncbi:MAG: endonuclease III [Clostridiales Family XIII bacterium]|jgi:endonuclease-3|nr:endonuclease III [Clostridiales Family XIII bacterium]
MSILSKGECEAVLDVLAQLYPGAVCALEHGSAFQLLVAVALSAQTTDKSVNKATPELFRRFPDAAAMAQADMEELQGLLKTLGMYRTKAANIKKMSEKLVSGYGGEIPGDFDGLVALPGVGRKTANVVLAVWFGEQRIPVDTHVFRVANRIGLCREKNVLDTEKALMARLPEGRWTEAHHSIIFHGRNCCRARAPECASCALGGMGLCRAAGAGGDTQPPGV